MKQNNVKNTLLLIFVFAVFGVVVVKLFAFVVILVDVELCGEIELFELPAFTTLFKSSEILITKIRVKLLWRILIFT
jgi:hypothetical protein